MNNSIWLEHPKYPGYLASPEGNIISLRGKSPRVLTMKPNRDGYLTVAISSKSKFVHRLVAEIYAPGKTNDDFRICQVNHKDGNKLNNNASNLEWVTASQNQRHRHDVLRKRCAIGEKSGSAKLTEKQVRSIRKELSTGKRGIMTKLSKEYNISIGNVHAIKIKRSWDFLN